MANEDAAVGPLTVGARYDFDALRRANRDSDGQSLLSPPIETFLEYSSAMLNRIPSDWQRFFPAAPGDLEVWLAEVTQLLDQIRGIIERPIGERATVLTNHAGQAQATMARQLGSMQHVVTLMAIAEAKTGSRDRFERELASLTNLAGEQVDKAHDAAGKVEELLRSTQAATAKTVAAGRARIFAIEANNANSAARAWLFFSAVALVVLMVAAGFAATGKLLPRPEAADAFAVANYVLGKVLILGSIAFAVTFGVRQYSAYRHLATMNRHRSNALSTYRAIIEASRSETSHDIILTEAAQAIFTPQDSGFVRGSGGDPNGIVQIVQGLLRSPSGHSIPGS